MQARSVDSSLLAALQNIQKASGAGSSVCDEGVRYKFVPTQRNKRKLIDINAGHTYTVRKVYKNTTLWQCTMRNKNIYCRATLQQSGNKFKKGNNDHIHPGQLGVAEFTASGKVRKRRAHKKKSTRDEAISQAVTTISESFGQQRQENILEMPQFSGISTGPSGLGSEVSISQAAAEDSDDSSDDDDDTDQVQRFRPIQVQSEHLQPEMSTGSQPVHFEGTIQDGTREHVVASADGSVGPGVVSDADVIETIAEEFKEQRAPDAEYTIVDGSSQRRNAKLTDSAGYTYCLKSRNSYTSYWRCSIRNKSVMCRASVVQTGEEFRRGQFDHIHPSNPNGAVAAKLVAQVKAKASLDPDAPMSNIVGEALVETVGYYQPGLGIPKPSNLVRAAKRLRQRLSRGSDSIHDSSIPADFLQKVIERGDKSHIFLASPQQLQLLSQMTRWYIDINPKVVKSPLKELVSIHAFVADDNEPKLRPMAFLLMSRKKRKDYKAVFSALKERLPGDLAVAECILDYEPTLWRAINDVFPGVQCSGSASHWSQAIWKKIQEFGIQGSQAYVHEPTRAYKLLRKLMALCYLPADLIPRMLNKLQEKANTGTLHQLLNYVEATWIEGPTCMWSPSVWSVYAQPQRINNDVEAWNKQLNSRIKKGKLPLSVLIMHLLSESKPVTAQAKPASKRHLKRYHSTVGKNHQIVKFWEEFKQGDRKLKQLLNACVTFCLPGSSHV
ncbi:uncharacterized protein LOC119729011 [Patiria miniata]|uniref:FLYWCH-type domain-containing protein n=1 Tax=Patiria miniata TaxID=46514 RepID=A0A914A1C0_PATMI|nr:uncharacterized protein LOC119729011 [Patiria miniata]